MSQLKTKHCSENYWQAKLQTIEIYTSIKTSLRTNR